MQTDAFQLNAFQQDGGASTLFTLTGAAAIGISGAVSVSGDARLSIAIPGTAAIAVSGAVSVSGNVGLGIGISGSAAIGLSGSVSVSGDVSTSDVPAPVAPTYVNKTGRRNYIVKGKLYRNVTNEELAYLLARDLIDVTREDVKVKFAGKKPHKVSTNAWTELQESLKLFDKYDPVPWDDDEEAAMLLL